MLGLNNSLLLEYLANNILTYLQKECTLQATQDQSVIYLHIS